MFWLVNVKNDIDRRPLYVQGARDPVSIGATTLV